ncbi:hypothetical protein [uncultured Methylobacterium sp.]|uniref:hypothetical protein n=1 Tax=uncultured Methylobacterium sp. TaxID=157278 RepID=UPI0035CBD985
MAFVSATIMEEGKAAKMRGEPLSADPYPVGSQESADWLEGYTFDEAEQNFDEDDA